MCIRQVSPSKVGLMLTKGNRESLQASWTILVSSRELLNPEILILAKDMGNCFMCPFKKSSLLSPLDCLVKQEDFLNTFPQQDAMRLITDVEKWLL